MKYRVETITPERARAMLDKTEALGFTNRSIRRLRVEKLEHAIVTGQWRLTHQPLALTAAGAVLDGQHRLAAIVLAGQAVDMLVVRDADPETFSVVDTGAARTTGDSLKIAGYRDVNHLSAMVRGFLVYDRIIGTTDNYRTSVANVTTVDVLDFLDDPEQRDVAIGALSIARTSATALARYGLTTSLGMALLETRLRDNELGPTTVAEFFARLADGVSLKADSPILALRRWFMSETGYARINNEQRRPTATANTLKALNDYALGKPRSIVVFKIGQEPFPAPLPKGSRLRYERELEAAERKQAGDDDDAAARRNGKSARATRAATTA